MASRHSWLLHNNLRCQKESTPDLTNITIDELYNRLWTAWRFVSQIQTGLSEQEITEQYDEFIPEILTTKLAGVFPNGVPTTPEQVMQCTKDQLYTQVGVVEAFSIGLRAKRRNERYNKMEVDVNRVLTDENLESLGAWVVNLFNVMSKGPWSALTIEARTAARDAKVVNTIKGHGKSSNIRKVISDADRVFGKDSGESSAGKEE